MGIYLVRMERPDGDGWKRHVVDHVRYLKELIANGQFLASGPLTGNTQRAGFLVMKAHDRPTVQAFVDADPFAREGLVIMLEWYPLFGMLAEHSSKRLPPELNSLS